VSRSCPRAGRCSARWRRRIARRAQIRFFRTLATTTRSDTSLALARGPSPRTPGAPPPASSGSPLSSSGAYRARFAPLATFSDRPWRRFGVILIPFRRGRGLILCITSTLLLRLALSLPLLTKVVDDLLQSLARIGFTVSRRNNTTSRVDAKKFVQVALFIQCLRLQCKVQASKYNHPCRMRGKGAPGYAFASSG
jgi:hypothetical protein